ncbi:hypothetical protein BDR03DRAFT_877386, partial [Suillus americanus]
NLSLYNSIGQGDPLSMTLYIIYRCKPLTELTLAFVDDMALVAIGKDFTDTHHILKDMLERPGGGFDWSQCERKIGARLQQN